jgi:hypothetical protein
MTGGPIAFRLLVRKQNIMLECVMKQHFSLHSQEEKERERCSTMCFKDIPSVTQMLLTRPAS